ncbi:MAG: hypothetical protein A2X13_14065 [Bacteroidetes bacterium GWC2_33_15]|nr:MAG: hypothetical protein A2X10_09280 [Bacteroidetes bacterium GWA2_33_15]OFX50466.1 MAG: hypothetical protein A2X13_14065 [Bacteroidetes bacterium GWC2_33_15]OFX66616.1 MAG: hypothetical protein A2X15_07810 [Bacteroidetes bacterium GWB2_32_14]OFX69234.1 MAG: hypothetical protein A2X14_08740 [Bacteroidetes bacterium GWD2_33_33]HAN18545.1 Clp protease ClpS [Bacteroidales bacterium]
MNSKRKFENDPNLEMGSNDGKDYSLILHNDDVNDFEHVINSLIDVCSHDSVQAEQCAYLVHYCGSCDIKTGKYDGLLTMKNKLAKKGLTVSIS